MGSPKTQDRSQSKRLKSKNLKEFAYYIGPVALAALRAAWATSISKIRETKIRETKIRETKIRETKIRETKIHEKKFFKLKYLKCLIISFIIHLWNFTYFSKYFT